MINTCLGVLPCKERCNAKYEPLNCQAIPCQTVYTVICASETHTRVIWLTPYLRTNQDVSCSYPVAIRRKPPPIAHKASQDDPLQGGSISQGGSPVQGCFGPPRPTILG